MLLSPRWRDAVTIVAAYLCLSGASARTIHQAHIVIGDVSSRDRARAIYDVAMPPLASVGYRPGGPGSEVSLEGEIMDVTTSRGQKMLCGVPEGVPEIQDESAGGAWDFSGVEEMMDSYRGRCFKRREGWWDFVFCYGAYVEQNHASVSEGDLSVTYTLGQLDGEFNEERMKLGAGERSVGGEKVGGGEKGGVNSIGVKSETSENDEKVEGGEKGGKSAKSEKGGKSDKSEKSESSDIDKAGEGEGGKVDIDAPYTQLFGNGTVCDITGKPREILVKYKCNREASMIGGSSAKAVAGMEFISPLREVGTCVYEIDFVNAAICNHPAYKSKLDKNKMRIQCIMQEKEEPFLGLATTVYRKASINL